MKGVRFEAVSSIQQTVTRELKSIREETIFQAFDLSHKPYKRCADGYGYVLSYGINKYFFIIFEWVFMSSVRELNYYTGYVQYMLENRIILSARDV
jgi:hypothetical protein